MEFFIICVGVLDFFRILIIRVSIAISVELLVAFSKWNYGSWRWAISNKLHNLVFDETSNWPRFSLSYYPLTDNINLFDRCSSYDFLFNSILNNTHPIVRISASFMCISLLLLLISRYKIRVSWKVKRQNFAIP